MSAALIDACELFMVFSSPEWWGARPVGLALPVLCVSIIMAAIYTVAATVSSTKQIVKAP